MDPWGQTQSPSTQISLLEQYLTRSGFVSNIDSSPPAHLVHPPTLLLARGRKNPITTPQLCNNNFIFLLLLRNDALFFEPQTNYNYYEG
mmetsp:Transcript_19950/g.29992  ORF Transcript_19950/g.29992 Transcript_19950/m.29992 type:complete len:89 (-) Transcript_19950:29-295(-)